MSLEIGNLGRAEVWTLACCGLTFEIRRWKVYEDKEYDEPLGCSGTNGKWNYYVIVPIATLPKPYHKEEKWADIDFHGGMTYFRREQFTRYNKGVRWYLKVGCDYAHYQDGDRVYDLQDILADVRVTATNIHEVIKPMLTCRGCGGVEQPTDWTAPVFYCIECKAKQEARKCSSPS